MLEWREHFLKHFVARHETELKLNEIAHVIPDNHPVTDGSTPALSGQGAVCDDKPQEQ